MHLFRPALLGLALASAACADRTLTAPTTDEPLPTAAGARPESAPMQRLAHRLARALRDSAFRAELKAHLDTSSIREGKLHFRRLLAHRPVSSALARLNGEDESLAGDDARLSGELELYLPVAEHRAAWAGDANVLVATQRRDGETPVAYAPDGRRLLLDPHRPPTTPVIALVPAETDFDREAAPRPRHAIACPDCGDDGGGSSGGGGGGSGTTPSTAGLYLTSAHFVETFEGWLKGSPEFEIHILGQLGTSDSLTSYQCTGAQAGWPYGWDMNGKDWTGSALLFSATQLASYRSQHPGQNFRIVALEDDDTACAIKWNGNGFRNLIAALQSAYGVLTGAKDSATAVGGLAGFGGSTIKRANALQKVLRAAYSFITTQDDLIGNAIEDVVVGQRYPGANWIVKGENNVTHGWLKLEMK